MLQDLGLQLLWPAGKVKDVNEFEERLSFPFHRVGLSDGLLQKVFEELELRDETGDEAA